MLNTMATGGFLVQRLTWRWIFWCFSLVDAGFFLAAPLLVRETYGPFLLYLKGKHVLPALERESFTTRWSSRARRARSQIALNIGRPLQMMTQSIVQVLCVYMALLYGIMFLLLFNFPLLWTTIYMEQDGIGSLNYISIGLGYVIGSQGKGRRHGLFLCPKFYSC